MAIEIDKYNQSRSLSAALPDKIQSGNALLKSGKITDVGDYRHVNPELLETGLKVNANKVLKNIEILKYDAKSFKRSLGNKPQSNISRSAILDIISSFKIAMGINK